MEKLQVSLKNKGKTQLLYRGQGGCWEAGYKQKGPWSKLGIRSILAFHWESYDSLLLAELFPGEEENLFSSSWGSEVVSKVART